jgi:hypothetical protein
MLLLAMETVKELHKNLPTNKKECDELISALLDLTKAVNEKRRELDGE